MLGTLTLESNGSLVVTLLLEVVSGGAKVEENWRFEIPVAAS